MAGPPSRKMVTVPVTSYRQSTVSSWLVAHCAGTRGQRSPRPGCQANWRTPQARPSEVSRGSRRGENVTVEAPRWHPGPEVDGAQLRGVGTLVLTCGSPAVMLGHLLHDRDRYGGGLERRPARTGTTREISARPCESVRPDVDDGTGCRLCGSPAWGLTTPYGGCKAQFMRGPDDQPRDQAESDRGEAGGQGAHGIGDPRS